MDGEARLTELLVEAQELGLVGPGPVDRHVAHARGFAEAVGEEPAGGLVDLGSGGGIPGLVLALVWPSTSWVLVDGRARSASFLAGAVESLHLQDRVRVIEGRGEVLGRMPEHRGRHEVVVARGLAVPAATAECAAGFLVPGGRLVVSEPPGSSGDRWEREGLHSVGMEFESVATSNDAGYAILRQVSPCPSRYPRRTGIPTKRPLF